VVNATLHSAETLDDMQRLRALFSAFHALAKLPGDYDCGVEQRLVDLVDAGAVSVMYVEVGGEPVGVVGAMESPDLFTQQTVLSELFWFVRPDARGTPVARILLDAFEALGEALGARQMRLMALEHLFPDRVGKIYARRGYARREILWEKAVE